MGIQLDDSHQLRFPGGRDCSHSAWCGSPGNGIQPSREEAFEDTYHRVLASQHDLGDLSRGLTRYGEQKHLIAGTRFGIGGVIVATAQLGQGLFVQWRECDGSSHLFFPFFTLPHFSLALYHFSAHFTWKHLAVYSNAFITTSGSARNERKVSAKRLHTAQHSWTTLDNASTPSRSTGRNTPS